MLHHKFTRVHAAANTLVSLALFPVSRQCVCVRRSPILHQRHFTYSPFRPPPNWNALQKLVVKPRLTDEGESTLDGTLDMVGYQLFLDGLLPRSHVSGRTIRDVQSTPATNGSSNSSSNSNININSNSNSSVGKA